MSVEEWLESTFGNSAAAGRSAGRSARLENSRSDSHAGEQAGAVVVRGARLADTVAKLNARLEQLTAGRAPADGQRPQPVARDRSPPLAPEPVELGIDQVIAEIAARQRALEEAPAPPRRGSAARRQPRARPRRISPASNGSSTTSPRRSRRCAARAASRTRSRRCAPTSPTSRAPSTRRCRAARSKALQGDVHALAERIEQRLWRRRRPVGAARHRAPPRRGARARSTR